MSKGFGKAGNPAHKVVAFHGTDYPTQELEPKWMAHADANQQEGVGIYFATNRAVAESYGSILIEADLDLDRFVPSRDLVEDHFTVEEIAALLFRMGQARRTDDMYYFITNWFEFLTAKI